MEVYTQLKGRMKSLFLYFALSFLMTGTILLGFAQTIRGQASPDMGFITAAIKETILGKERQTGLFQEKADTIRNANGKDVIDQKKVRTWIFIETDRIFYEYELVRFDPNVEAPESYWWGGYADLNGKLTAAVDSSEWFYSLIPEYYHPEARYIITIASVVEEYKPHHLAILDMQGKVISRMAMPKGLIFSRDRTVMAYVEEKKQGPGAQQWRLHYKNLELGQDWEIDLSGIRPRPRLVNPEDNGLVYTWKDTVFCVDRKGHKRWATPLPGVCESWFISGDARHFYHTNRGLPLKAYGQMVRQLMYSRESAERDPLMMYDVRAIEGSPYVFVIWLEPGGAQRGFALGPDPDFSKEWLIPQGHTDYFSGYFFKDKKEYRIFHGQKLVLKWRDGYEGEINQQGPE